MSGIRAASFQASARREEVQGHRHPDVPDADVDHFVDMEVARDAREEISVLGR
jgi:hypothetical protein